MLRLSTALARRAARCRWLSALNIALALTFTTGADPARSQVWVPAWTASPAFPLFDEAAGAPPSLDNITLQQPIRLAAGGTAVRVRVSNETGTSALHIGGLSLDTGDGISHVLRFSGQTEVQVGAGEAWVSDPLAVHLEAFSTLSLAVYLPRPSRPTVRPTPLRFAPGHIEPDAQGVFIDRQGVVSAVLVLTKTPPAVVVAFGDSITQGATSTVGANADWPARLGGRLDLACPGRFAVLNAGISGNRLLTPGRSPSGLARFERDVLTSSRTETVIVLLGINDIVRSQVGDRPPGSTADQVIAGYHQLTERLHDRGLRVIGGTLTPFADSGRYEPEAEAKRQALNAFIRTSPIFDAVIDFDRALADPNRPEALHPGFHGGDNLHPNDRGYDRMAEAVDLGLFGVDRC